MKQVVIYTDGACSDNPGPGGWAAVLLYEGTRKIVKGSVPLSTNNIMELTAPIEALRLLKTPCVVDIFTDSKYVRDGIVNWIKAWQKNGWLTAAKKPVKNRELWLELNKLEQLHSVSWHWVKAHSDNDLNNLVDRLARSEAKSQSTKSE